MLVNKPRKQPDLILNSARKMVLKGRYWLLQYKFGGGARRGRPNLVAHPFLTVILTLDDPVR